MANSKSVLKIYNFLRRRKEVFRPIKRGRVGFYACGPTVYNYAHIGNLRTYIFEDILRRTLEYAGYRVKHVMNITDIDDKIIAGARSAKKNIDDFSAPYKTAFFGDVKKINILPAWKYPEASGHIPEMVKIAKRLLQKKIAYFAKDGIYFDISKFKSYGRLANPKPGNRKNFAIWKRAKKSEPSWKSPFGPGRPGWHLECSAMSMKYLGAGFDIHAGGVDLLFPHHENEVAQSEGATGKKFVKYFVEGEHLLVNGKKMSKSLGNIFTLRDLERRGFNPLALRYLMLSAHYRSQLNFTWESLRAAEHSLERLYEFVRTLKTLPRSSKPGFKSAQKPGFFPRGKVLTFQKAIFNDLNTPKALAVVHAVMNEYYKNKEKFAARAVLELFYDFDRVLGLGLAGVSQKHPPPGILKLLKEREGARKLGDFKKADKIREKLKKMGWQVNDTGQDSRLV
ncbi:cysteine--tRNA ligase [Candidatus Giovannonibacteria bacterium RIFCSPHIGHO2_01_FULL_45_24]|uniref:Cysteine--tRNA ligase n=1 Tax=Candidatus Giovannonibacteria bacterium RIFCSPLOWO2_01_FULL_46_32 TaxID=1798353 RepID=A0A1F5XG65_9BACT|nr:MAG: cysteine--tRNA ligase [Candidatus Giovannonibacteria bacterium RIFCSPHIGHO2_01_FULL_45_24]OGF86918.1 MAG: cysteine--tRNA ligase [Candidatus Giovannonibacteria bacterium RIFCSPLOWO2_01_FULL_46_32]